MGRGFCCCCRWWCCFRFVLVVGHNNPLVNRSAEILVDLSPASTHRAECNSRVSVRRLKLELPLNFLSLRTAEQQREMWDRLQTNKRGRATQIHDACRLGRSTAPERALVVSLLTSLETVLLLLGVARVRFRLSEVHEVDNEDADMLIVRMIGQHRRLCRTSEGLRRSVFAIHSLLELASKVGVRWSRAVFKGAHALCHAASGRADRALRFARILAAVSCARAGERLGHTIRCSWRDERNIEVRIEHLHQSALDVRQGLVVGGAESVVAAVEAFGIARQTIPAGAAAVDFS